MGFVVHREPNATTTPTMVPQRAPFSGSVSRSTATRFARSALQCQPLQNSSTAKRHGKADQQQGVSKDLLNSVSLIAPMAR